MTLINASARFLYVQMTISRCTWLVLVKEVKSKDAAEGAPKESRCTGRCAAERQVALCKRPHNSLALGVGTYNQIKYSNRSAERSRLGEDLLDFLQVERSLPENGTSFIHETHFNQHQNWGTNLKFTPKCWVAVRQVLITWSTTNRRARWVPHGTSRATAAIQLCSADHFLTFVYRNRHFLCQLLIRSILVGVYCRPTSTHRTVLRSGR